MRNILSGKSKGTMVAFQAKSDLSGHNSSQAAGLGCRIMALQAETPNLSQRTLGVAQGWYGSGLSPYNHMTFNAIIPNYGMSLELFLTKKHFMRLSPKSSFVLHTFGQCRQLAGWANKRNLLILSNFNSLISHRNRTSASDEI